MNDFLLLAACFILVVVALGLLRVLRGPADVDRMMAAQLLGTGSVAIILLSSVATGQTMLINVALILAVLAAFAGLAFVNSGDVSGQDKMPGVDTE